jgi:glycosyltransferase involved in cell wall biosynthesis
MKYGVLIPARDEEENIRRSLNSLLNQTAKPFIVTVVDDSSSDRTGEVAKGLGALVIRVEREGKESMAGKPYMAYLLNQGLKALRRYDLSYLMISGADCIYPPKYVEELVSRMVREGQVMASGIARGEVTSEYGIRGAGRIIDVGWFKVLGFRFPENYGFEAWLVYRALKEGKGVGVYRDLKFTLLRETTIDPEKAYHWGKAMRALNYWWAYALGRCMALFFKSPKSGFSMLRGYMSSVKKYDDVAGFVPKFQKRIILKKLKGSLIGP